MAGYFDRLTSMFSKEKDPNAVDWDKVSQDSLASANGARIPGMATMGVGNDTLASDVTSNAVAKQAIDNTVKDTQLQDISSPKKESSTDYEALAGLVKDMVPKSSPMQKTTAPRMETPEDVMSAKRAALMSMFSKR